MFKSLANWAAALESASETALAAAERGNIRAQEELAKAKLEVAAQGITEEQVQRAEAMRKQNTAEIERMLEAAGF